MSGCMDELLRFREATPTERLEDQVRRLVEQIMEPEHRRIGELLKSGASTRQIEAGAPITDADAKHRVLELMELAVTERAHEIDWTPKFTPTTLRKVMREMGLPKVKPLEDDPLKRQLLRMVLGSPGLVDHNAFAVVTKPGWKP